MALPCAGIDPAEFAKALGKLRDLALFGEEGGQLGPMSEQHYLLAIGALEQAERFAKLAGYHQMRKD